MEILPYQDWMRPQVIAMFVDEYGVIADDFEKLFTDFYESAFQEGKCIRIVAVEGDKVGGFQSFFYWPISINGEKKYTLQSGNSLVHPDFRGKGLFAKMLDYIHLPENNYNVDGLIGFPVQMSYNSFIRNKWSNPFNLQWYVKPINPLLSLFSSAEDKLSQQFGPRKAMTIVNSETFARIEQSEAFDGYRFAFQQGTYWRYLFTQGEETCLFEFKIQIRKKWIQELVIGKCVPSSYDESFITKAFFSFTKEIQRTTSVTLMSFACNPLVSVYTRVMRNTGFRKIDKSIYFITKGKIANYTTDWSNWDIQRGDIDTW